MGHIYDLIAAGAGPAGLMAAIAAARSGAEVLLAEKMPSPGRKLLVSGAGRCNFSHGGPIADFERHYGEAGRFLRPALRAFTNEDAAEFFREGGIELLETEGGKLFPASGRARDLLDRLLSECRSLGVELRCGAALLGVEAREGGFRLESSVGRLETKTLVISTGGASYPGTGSAGEGWGLAAALGHRIAETAPALSPLLFEGFEFAELSGFALRDRGLAAYRGGKKAAAGRGDLLFTHRGLSGPGILDLSRSLRPGDELRIEVAGRPASEIEELLRQGAASHGKRLVRSLLEPLGLPSRLGELLLARAGLPPELRAAELDKARRRRAAEALAELRLKVEALGGYEEAMVSRGGVAREELDPKTLGSRLVPGLYFAGEVIDIDGDTGGYNIQAALSTGYLAGMSAAALLARRRGELGAEAGGFTGVNAGGITGAVDGGEKPAQ